jgi:integrase
MGHWVTELDTLVLLPPRYPTGLLTMSKKLTDISISKIRPDPTKRIEIPDAGKPGLYLVVQPNGKKSWAIRYRRLSDGKSRKLTIDGLPSLAVAHRLAQKALDRAAEGRDPAAEKRVSQATKGARGSNVFKAITGQFLERYIKPNARASYAYETKRLLDKDVIPAWGDRQIQDVTKRDVLDLLDGVVDRGGGLTANRVLAAIRKLFNWAVDRGIIETSPAAGVRAPLPEQSRDRVLSDDELRSLWLACDKRGYPWGDFTKLLLLTGQRRTEVGGMTWSELDLDKKEWNLPAHRTKNGEAHTIPLPEVAVDIIKALPRIASDGDFLFTVNGGSHVTGYSRAKADLSAPDSERWTFHDLRRTAATGMARLGISLPVIEKVLNHTSGSFAGIVGVYQRHSFADEKRTALEVWAKHVTALVA